MPMPEQIAEMNIREHEARAKRIDELMEKAEAEASGDAIISHGLTEIKKEKERIDDYIEGLKEKSPQEFLETAGPMVMWEILAEKLEHLIEGIKKAG